MKLFLAFVAGAALSPAIAYVVYKGWIYRHI